MKYDQDQLLLAVNSACGVYSPLVFVEKYADKLLRPTRSDKENIETVLLGPNENGSYWDSWQDLECLVYVIDGIEYHVMQEDDIWLIPVGMEYPEN